MKASSISWRRLGFFAAVWAVLGGGALMTSSCYGRNCEGSPKSYGLDGGQGEMLDPDTWESTPYNGQWLPFPRQTTYTITMPLGGRTPYDVHMIVSAQQNPAVDPGGNATTGAGNLTEQSAWGPNRVNAINDTCSDYFLRVVAYAAPFGTADASSTPATTTATVDAGSDATVP